MDETTLRTMLDRATATEPPIGSLARNALRAGIRLRRRRRATGAATSAAAVAVLAAGVPAVTGAIKNTAASHGDGPLTAWVVTDAQTIVPITLADDKAGKPIRITAVDLNPDSVAISPGGRAVYEISGRGIVTPIDTAARKAGQPITVPGAPQAIVITPNGRAAYVPNSHGVVPIDLTAGKALQPIRWPDDNGVNGIVISPDGKTAYVTGSEKPVRHGFAGTTVVPISTATNKALKPITLDTPACPQPTSIVCSTFDPVISQDGKTVYVLWGDLVFPIRTATNKALPPIAMPVHMRNGFNYGHPEFMAITPDGRLAYVATGNKTVVPVRLATGKVLKPIALPGAPEAMAITPDGATVYVTVPGLVVPISTATNAAGQPIRVGNQPNIIVITPDGHTALVSNEGVAGHNFLTPISTATDRAGKRIYLNGVPIGMVITP